MKISELHREKEKIIKNRKPQAARGRNGNKIQCVAINALEKTEIKKKNLQCAVINALQSVVVKVEGFLRQIPVNLDSGQSVGRSVSNTVTTSELRGAVGHIFVPGHG